jgi:hypothetical protein
MTGEKQIQVDRIWDVIEKARVCMMATQFSDGLRVRPMEALHARSSARHQFRREGERPGDAVIMPEEE